MNNLYNRLMGQLDSLIPFLALTTHHEVFDLIQERYGDWYPAEQSNLPETYALYQTQVAHSAFLLGYSYYEAYLSDLARQIYTHKPAMLPRDKELKFSEILEHPEFEQLLAYMIDTEILSIFYLSIEKVIECFEKKFKLAWPEHSVEPAIEASLLRNCIIHNNARVDKRLSMHSNLTFDTEINLTEERVHQFGVNVRQVCNALARQAESKFFSQ